MIAAARNYQRPTQQELSALVQDARQWLNAHYGPNAVELAERGVASAADTYDGQTKFWTWTIKNLKWAASEEYRFLFGRPSSAKRRNDTNRRDAAGFDGAAAASAEPETREQPMARMVEAESTLEQLRFIETLEGAERWIVLGRFLGDFTNADLSRMIGRKPNSMSRALHDLRESLSTD